MTYIPYTEEEKNIANTVDLVEFLRFRGEKLERAGHEYKLIYTDGSGSHDSITINGSKWFDHKNQTGGGAIQFMQYHYGIDFQSAMSELLGQKVSAIPNISQTKSTEKSKEFKLPERNSNMHRVYAYLIKQRCIDSKIISHFAENHTLYEDRKYHNAVFVGLDENGVPRQAHKRSTASYGKAFRITCEGSDTRYSFAHFGKSKRLYVFEAPIDMLSFITLYPENWQKYSYIAMNGVYENAVLTALENHTELSEIMICVDSDEGGIDAADRLKDILVSKGYPDVIRFAPVYKDWNEQLKAKMGKEALPAVPHRRKEEYLSQIEKLEFLKCRPDKLSSQIYATFKNGQYIYLAEYALVGSAFFLSGTSYFKDENRAFLRLCDKLGKEYKPYTDKGRIMQKQRNLSDCVKAVVQDLKQTARTEEQSVQTSKLLYKLADSAVRLVVEEIMNNPVPEQMEEIESDMCFENTDCDTPCRTERYL